MDEISFERFRAFNSISHCEAVAILLAGKSLATINKVHWTIDILVHSTSVCHSSRSLCSYYVPLEQLDAQSERVDREYRESHRRFKVSVYCPEAEDEVST